MVCLGFLILKKNKLTGLLSQLLYRASTQHAGAFGLSEAAAVRPGSPALPPAAGPWAVGRPDFEREKPFGELGQLSRLPVRLSFVTLTGF